MNHDILNSVLNSFFTRAEVVNVRALGASPLRPYSSNLYIYICIHKTRTRIHTDIHTYIHVYIHIYRDRETETETERQTDRQTARHADMQTCKQTDIHAYIHVLKVVER